MFNAFILIHSVTAVRCIPAVHKVNSYLVSEVLLLAAVSPAGCVTAPAATAGWTPLSAASLTSVDNYTVKNTSLNELFQGFTQITTKLNFSHTSSGTQPCRCFYLSRT